MIKKTWENEVVPWGEEIFSFLIFGELKILNTWKKAKSIRIKRLV